MGRDPRATDALPQWVSAEEIEREREDVEFTREQEAAREGQQFSQRMQEQRHQHEIGMEATERAVDYVRGEIAETKRELEEGWYPDEQEAQRVRSAIETLERVLGTQRIQDEATRQEALEGPLGELEELRSGAQAPPTLGEQWEKETIEVDGNRLQRGADGQWEVVRGWESEATRTGRERAERQEALEALQDELDDLDIDIAKAKDPTTENQELQEKLEAKRKRVQDRLKIFNEQNPPGGVGQPAQDQARPKVRVDESGKATVAPPAAMGGGPVTDEPLEMNLNLTPSAGEPAVPLPPASGLDTLGVPPPAQPSARRPWNEDASRRYGEPVPESMRPKGKAYTTLYQKGYDYVPLLSSTGEETGQYAWRPPEGLERHEIVPSGKYFTGQISLDQLQRLTSTSSEEAMAARRARRPTPTRRYLHKLKVKARHGDRQARQRLTALGESW
jgi:hypothetical protein